MPDPSTATYLGLPGFLVLWLLALAAFSLFGSRALRLIGTLRKARGENRRDRIPERLGRFFFHVFGQRRLLREPVFGLAHLFIFWAFVFYAASFAWNLLRGLLPVLALPYADEVAWVTWPMEVLSVVALAGLAVAAARRYVFTPAGLERSRDASLVLALIAVLLVTFLAGQGSRALAGEEAGPLAGWLAGGFAAAGVAPAATGTLYLWAWWLHMATVLAFLAYLPYSKHLHLLAAPFSVFFSDLRAGAMPPASEGANRRSELTWRQQLNALACAECGRCERVCPAFACGFPLSPKALVHGLKEIVLDGDAEGSQLVGEVASPEAIWACTSCLACTDRCPVFNEHLPLVTELRRHLLAEGEVEERLQKTLMAVHRYGNSFGKAGRARGRWTRGLGFEIPDARKTPVEYLWWVGDYASYDPRLKKVTRAAARLFHRAGLDFGILYQGEQTAGNDVRRIGEETLFQLLREKNRAALAGARFEQIVSTDPHTYHALRHEYGNGDAVPAGARVLHVTELLDRLVQDGRLPLSNGNGGAMTYHDPCYLGRYNGVYDAPRRLLRALGAELVEMPRSRAGAFCCGAGGGRIWMEDSANIKERPAESRVREAASLEQVETLAVSCPKDLVMFQDAVKTTGLQQRMAVRDVVELVAAAAGASDRSDSHEQAQR